MQYAMPEASAGAHATVSTHASAVKRISWAAVFAGLIIAMVVQLSLGMLGTGIGMGTIDPMQYDTPGVRALSLGAGIWWAVSSLISLFVGGWVASHLAGVPRTIDGVLHGLLTWGVTTLLTFWLIGSAIGTVVGGAFNVAGSVATTAGQGLAAAAPKLGDAASAGLANADVSWESIKGEATRLLEQTGKPELQPGAIAAQAGGVAADANGAAGDAARNPMGAGAELDGLLDRVVRQGKGTASAADRDAVVNVLVQRGMSRPEATKTVEGWETTYRAAQQKIEQASVQAEQQAREAAEATANALSKAALWGFLALVLGAVASAAGGAAGRPRMLVTDRTQSSGV